MTEIFKSFSSAHVRVVQGTLTMAAIAGLAGCGNNYRPVTTPIVPSGPAAQPTSEAFIISTPSTSAAGIATLVDYSGDAIMDTVPIGIGPLTFAMNSGGGTAWSIDTDGTVANIPIGTAVQAKDVKYSTLNNFTNGVNPIVQLYSGALGLYALDAQNNEVDVLTGTPDAFNRTVPVDAGLITMAGSINATRLYAITQTIPYLGTTVVDGATTAGSVACNVDAHSAGLPSGFADSIETATYTVSAHIPVGVCPVYGVASLDTRRVYVLNRGSDSVSVINSQINTIDSCAPFKNQNGDTVICHPSFPLTGAAGMAHAGPVYAEYNQATSQLIVANYEGNSISIIDVSLDEYGNDSATFGTTFTVPVGKNPASVTVLPSGSRAYVANQSDGTVSIVNLASHTVEKTLPVFGHPRTVVSTANSLYGKVYVVSPDTTTVTILRTDTDVVDATILVQGNAIDVRTTSPDAASSNVNTVSRMPGGGEPCYLPPSAFATAGASITQANCLAQDPAQLTATPAP